MMTPPLSICANCALRLKCVWARAQPGAPAGIPEADDSEAEAGEAG
jgi:hypothetical protein